MRTQQDVSMNTLTWWCLEQGAYKVIPVFEDSLVINAYSFLCTFLIYNKNIMVEFLPFTHIVGHQSPLMSSLMINNQQQLLVKNHTVLQRLKLITLYCHNPPQVFNPVFYWQCRQKNGFTIYHTKNRSRLKEKEKVIIFLQHDYTC